MLWSWTPTDKRPKRKHHSVTVTLDRCITVPAEGLAVMTTLSLWIAASRSHGGPRCDNNSVFVTLDHCITVPWGGLVVMTRTLRTLFLPRHPSSAPVHHPRDTRGRCCCWSWNIWQISDHITMPDKELFTMASWKPSFSPSFQENGTESLADRKINLFILSTLLWPSKNWTDEPFQQRHGKKYEQMNPFRKSNVKNMNRWTFSAKARYKIWTDEPFQQRQGNKYEQMNPFSKGKVTNHHLQG